MSERDQLSETFQQYLDSLTDLQAKQTSAEHAEGDYEAMKKRLVHPIRGRDFDHLQEIKTKAQRESTQVKTAEGIKEELEEKLLGFIEEADGPMIATLGVQDYTLKHERGKLKWEKTE